MTEAGGGGWGGAVKGKALARQRRGRPGLSTLAVARGDSRGPVGSVDAADWGGVTKVRLMRRIGGGDEGSVDAADWGG